jgi:hypothetical protein
MDHDKHRRAEVPPTPKAAKGTPPRQVAPVAEAPEDYSDPVCVCEAEPYWQEVAERLEREARVPK